MNKADARHCLEMPAHRFRCKVDEERNELMGKGKSKAARAMAMNPVSREDCKGKSLVEIMEGELDAIIDRLMTGQEADDGRDPGRAEGVAYCIAVIRMPYNPSIPIIKEQAMERWEARSAE